MSLICGKKRNFMDIGTSVEDSLDTCVRIKILVDDNPLGAYFASTLSAKKQNNCLINTKLFQPFTDYSTVYLKSFQSRYQFDLNDVKQYSS